MVRQRKGAGVKPKSSRQKGSGPPAPFKSPPDVLKPLIETLDEGHVYVLHVDSKPSDLKRKVFIVPVLMNIAIAGLFVWRMYAMLPWYLLVFTSTLGYANETTMIAAEMEWGELIPEVAWRTGQFMLDFLLYIFLWPWPVEFAFGWEHSNPVQWRWSAGFRDKEVVARRSRSWDKAIKDVVNDEKSKKIFLSYVEPATSTMLLQEKTGYLLMNREWNLDWGVMIDAMTMVDKKMAALEAFRLVVLVFQEEYGWMIVDQKFQEGAEEDERRKQVFLFRDALAALGKEKLFYRWIEIVQYESTQPGGFGPEKQEATAKQIRELFEKEGVNFDELWKGSVGSETVVGM